MANVIFSRVLNPRSLLNVNNATVNALMNTSQRLPINLCMYTTANDNLESKLDVGEKPGKKISKSMRAYLERSKQYDEFLKKEWDLYHIGRRHLANMMGENPETFTQDDVNKAIRYLFPSGLFEPKARPIMSAPNEIFPDKKEAAFDDKGRPYHSMYYTGKPNYYEMLYNIASELQKLDSLEDNEIRKGFLPKPSKVELLGTSLFTQPILETTLLERVNTKEYDYFVACMERLIDHPLSAHATEFIMKYRKRLTLGVSSITALPIEYNDAGRPYVTVKHCMRKSARAEVTIWGQGSGKITINQKDITYFDDIQSREQVIFPLIFTNMLNKVDVEATVQYGGPTGQSGAIRWGIAWGLRSFVDDEMIKKMTVAGLLTRDWRRRERKKFGQEGARRKFAWRKR